MSKIIFTTLLLFAFCFAFSGCGGGSSNKVAPPKSQPDWVNNLPQVSNKVYGVGTANIGPNPVLARKKAEDDARQELGKSISFKVKSVMEKFTQEGQDLVNKENVVSYEVTTDVSKTVTEATVTGSQIIDRWEDAERNIIYALAVMDKSQIVTQIVEVVNNNSEKIFQADKKDAGMKKLDDELEKWDLSK